VTAIVGLGYLGFHATDVEEWRRFATDLLGLQVAPNPPGAPSEQLYLRMDERTWRFAIEPADKGGLAYTGWEVGDEESLTSLTDRLTSAGVSVKTDEALARMRQVEGLVSCEDPDGNVLEFFYGAHIAQEPFVSPRGVHFVTGELGLGHILQHVGDLDAAKDFYLGLLAFRLSDTIMFRAHKVHFAHVNPRHHSLAFVAVPGIEPGLSHFMLEVDSIDAVGRTLDLVNAGQGELTETLGKHTNDHMVSFYMRNPSGSQVEYGFAGRLVDDATWTIANYDSTSYWGHRVPGAEYTAPRDVHLTAS